MNFLMKAKEIFWIYNLRGILELKTFKYFIFLLLLLGSISLTLMTAGLL